MKDNQINYITRPASDLDYQYCYELTKENMYDLFCRHWGGWIESSFRKDFDVDATTIIIHNSSRVGYFSLKRNSEELFLDNLQLSQSIQGQGLGTRILQNILSNNKLKQISLTTFADNPAINLYRKAGFAVIDRKELAVHMSKFPPHI